MFSKKGLKFWTILGILILVIVIYILGKHTGFVTQALLKSGPLAPLVALFLYPLLAITPITTDPVTIIVSVAYGPLIGTLIGFVGNTLAAMVEYYFGFKLGQSINFKREKMPLGLGKMPVDSPLFLIFGRMIPGYGSKVISIVAAAYKVPPKRYLWTSALTSLLGSALLAYGGFGLINLLKF